MDIFFSYYVHPIFEHNFNFSLIKDALLLLLLIGVGLALFKRIRSRAMGMKRTTKHTWGDRVALSALWLIFPARLLAESMTSAVIWKFGGIVWALGEEHHLILPGIGCGSFLDQFDRRVPCSGASSRYPSGRRATGLVVLFHYAVRLFRGLAVLPLHAHLYGDPVDIPAECRIAKRREGFELRSVPDARLLTVRYLYRSVPASA